MKTIFYRVLQSDDQEKTVKSTGGRVHLMEKMADMAMDLDVSEADDETEDHLLDEDPVISIKVERFSP